MRMTVEVSTGTLTAMRETFSRRFRGRFSLRQVAARAGLDWSYLSKCENETRRISEENYLKVEDALLTMFEEAYDEITDPMLEGKPSS